MKKYNLSILMLKENIESAEQAIDNNKNISYRDIPLNSGKGQLYFKSIQPNSPKWVSLFTSVIDDDLNELKNSSASAVFIIKSKNRFFALTFGYGKSLLQNDCYEENFGLRIALNTIDAEKLRSIDCEHLDRITRQERSQTNIETALPNFGIDIEQDLIKAVTGKPNDETLLGKRLYGKDILKINISFSLEKIMPFLEKLENLYQKETYKENFGWIDNLKEVRDISLVNELNDQLVQKFKGNDNLNNILLVIPDIVDWSNIKGFRYAPSKQSPLFMDIDYESYKSFLDNKSIDITIDTFKKRSIYIEWEGTSGNIKQWSVYKCIYCESYLNKKNYILNSGKWYQIDHNFNEELNNDLSKIPQANLNLPEYDINDRDEDGFNEQKYNSYICDEYKDFYLMDRELIIHGGQNSKVEFCDIYSSIDKRLIHVKYDRGSSNLNHLFSQGYISAELLLFDEKFREKVYRKLNGLHNLNDLENFSQNPNANEYEVIFAIASTKKTRSTELPLFSKISLRNVYKKLTKFGIRTSLEFIKVIK